MDRTKLHDWIDAAPQHCAAILGELADQQVAALRETLAAFTTAAEPLAKPKRERTRKPRSPMAQRADVLDARGRELAREMVAEPALPFDNIDGRITQAVRNVLSVQPRRTYTLTALAAAVGLGRDAVAAEVRALQRQGLAVCVGRGKAAAWAGATPEPASSPRAVAVPPAEAEQEPDFDEVMP